MYDINIKNLLEKSWEEPCFFVNFHNYGRGIHSSNCTESSEDIKILHTTQILSWRVVNDKLEKCSAPSNGIFFDEEAYVIQWCFECRVDKTLMDEALVYYWKGHSAIKGYSPLPVDFDQNCPVERIRQWSEPPVFLQIFSGKMIVFSGKAENFNPFSPHLFIIRGEIDSELHLYEIPCKKENLRSRTTFLLVVPSKNVFVYWHGLQTLPQYKEHLLITFQPHEFLKKVHSNWMNFAVVQLHEGKENRIFVENVDGNLSDYYSLKEPANFTPRMFYLNSITGSFIATEIEYPLRSTEHFAPFPFLQSHLYTAKQPALFFIDNYSEIWLWQGWNPSDADLEQFEQEFKFAQDIIEDYAKEKEKIIDGEVLLKYAKAGLEPLEFTNLFPHWVKRTDIEEIQNKVPV